MSNRLAKNLFIVTAPSGAGKTTLIKNTLEYAEKNNEKVFISVSHTTRKPRKGEIDGIDYLFINENEFKSNIAKGVYVEHALVHGNLYGTPSKAIDGHLKDGYKVVYDKLTSKKSYFYEELENKDGVVSKRLSKTKDSEVIEFELEYNTDIGGNC